MRIPKCIHIVWLLIAAGLLTGCLLGCLSDQNGPGKEKPRPAAHVTLRIVDAVTGLPVPDVSVQVHDSESYRSGADGSVSLDIYEAGDHLAILEMDGYATMEEVMGISSSDVESGTQVSKQRLLHPLSLEINGHLTIQTTSSDSALPAPGVGVEILLPENFRERRKTATTDANGVFAFTGLPEKTAFSLRVPEATIVGRRFRLDAFPVAGAAQMQGTVGLPDLRLQLVPVQFAIVPNDSFDLGNDRPFTLDFTEPVDTAALTRESIAMEWVGSPYFVHATWSRSNTRLTVSPMEDAWPASGTLILVLSGFRNPEGVLLPPNRVIEKVLIRESTYVPEGLPESVDSAWLRARVARVGFWDPYYKYAPVPDPPGTGNFNTYWARPVSPPESAQWVDTNTIDYWTDTYTLHWRKAERARYYAIFQREDAQSPWQKVAVVGPETTYNVQFDPLVDTRPLRRQHLVVSGNAEGTSAQDQAPLIEVRDGICPSLFGAQLAFSGAYSHSVGQLFTPVRDFKFFNDSSDTDYIAKIIFNLEHVSSLVPLEPMDTTVIPTVTITEARGGRRQTWDPHYHADFISFTWVDRTSAIIKVRVAAGKNGLSDRLSVNVSNLTDLAGNHLIHTAVFPKPPPEVPATFLSYLLGDPYMYEE